MSKFDLSGIMVSMSTLLNRPGLTNRGTMCAKYVILHFLVVLFKKEKETDEINFHNVFFYSIYSKYHLFDW
jgi:hypothetical protein